MSLVMVKGATLKCSHGGQIQVSAGDPRLNVNGNGAVTSGMESGLSFAAGTPPCNNVTTTPTPPGPAPAPCVTLPATAGRARKLSVGGLPVLLDSATGPTVPAALPANAGTWSVASPGQAKLEAV
jgi:hypothetical protein